MSSTSPYRATARRGAVDAGQHVQAGRLAGPVRADERVHRAGRHGQRHLRERGDAAEADAQVLGHERRQVRARPHGGRRRRRAPVAAHAEVALAHLVAGRPARAAGPCSATRPTSSTYAVSASASAIAAFCSTSTTAVPLRWMLGDHARAMRSHHAAGPDRATVRPAAAPAARPSAPARWPASAARRRRAGRPAGRPARAARGTARRPAPRAAFAGARGVASPPARRFSSTVRCSKTWRPSGHLDHARADDRRRVHAVEPGARRTPPTLRRCAAGERAASRRSPAAACSCPRRWRRGRRRRRRAARRCDTPCRARSGARVRHVQVPHPQQRRRDHRSLGRGGPRRRGR